MVRHRGAWLLAAAVALGASAWSGVAQAGTAAPAPTVRAARSAAPLPVTHVVWIWEENHSYGDVIGSTAAPYINGLAHSYGLATNVRAISHPSAPNYIGATSGQALASLPHSDCTTCKQAGPNIFAQGETWRSYQESMTQPCAMQPSANGLYVPRHNAVTYFTDIPVATCRADDVALPAPAGSLAGGGLAAFTVVTPNLDDDMHSGTVAAADTWLATHLAPLLASPAFTDGSTVVFVVWDEGSGGGSLKGVDCTTSTSPSCHVPLLVLSTRTRGLLVTTALTHYSLLRATEDLLGLPRLGLAARAPDLLPGFGLG